MSARCATAFTTIAATGLLLSTLGGTTPHYIWNASKSVPIGLYRVQPATALAVTESLPYSRPISLPPSLISTAICRWASPCSSGSWRYLDKPSAETV